MLSVALASLPGGHPMSGQSVQEPGNTDQQYRQNLNSSLARWPKRHL